MKLYTEEDFLKAAEFCEVSMIDARYIIERIDEVTDPIELPSDEEIEEEAKWLYPLTRDLGIDSINHLRKNGFINGMKWLRDKIQQQ